MAKSTGKLYQCPRCEKTFSSIHALNGHAGMCKAEPEEQQPDPPKEEAKEVSPVVEESITLPSEDEDIEEPEEIPENGQDGQGKKEDDIPWPLLVPIIVVVFLVAGLIIFRDLILDFLGRRRPPTVAAPVGAGEISYV